MDLVNLSYELTGIVIVAPKQIFTVQQQQTMSSVKYPRFVKSVFFPPSQRPTQTPLSNQLKLEYIYGYSGKGTKGNILHMNDRGHLVYPSAASGVVWDYTKNTQVIFNQHDDDVIWYVE